MSQCLRSTLAIAASCIALVAAPLGAAAQDFSILLDQAKILRLPDRAATIVIGNPLVADGTLQPGGLLVVTGKTYGSTNLIALDLKGAVLAEYTLKVTAPKEGTVTVWRGTQRETWSCVTQCERAVVLGDSTDHFNAALSQVGTRNSAATNAQPAAK